MISFIVSGNLAVTLVQADLASPKAASTLRAAINVEAINPHSLLRHSHSFSLPEFPPVGARQATADPAATCSSYGPSHVSGMSTYATVFSCYEGIPVKDLTRERKSSYSNPVASDRSEVL